MGECLRVMLFSSAISRYFFVWPVFSGKKTLSITIVGGFNSTHLKNPPALPACLVEWGLMTDCLSVLCFCLYSLS